MTISGKHDEHHKAVGELPVAQWSQRHSRPCQGNRILNHIFHEDPTQKTLLDKELTPHQKVEQAVVRILNKMELSKISASECLLRERNLRHQLRQVYMPPVTRAKNPRKVLKKKKGVDQKMKQKLDQLVAHFNG